MDRSGAGGGRGGRGGRGGGGQREEEEEEKEEEDEEATDIKSNNPHLAGGEQTWSFRGLCEVVAICRYSRVIVHDPHLTSSVRANDTSGFLICSVNRKSPSNHQVLI